MNASYPPGLPSGPSRRRFLAGTAAVGAAALAGCLASGDVALTTGSRGETVTVADGTVLEVFAHNGDVRVVPADNRSDKLAVASRIATTGTGSAFERARIEVEERDDDRLVVRAVVDPSDAPFAPSVVHDVNVRVPDGVTVERVTTQNGEVDVEDVTGDVHASSLNGRVSVSGVDGVVVAESSNGDVRVRGTRGVARATTTNGGVDVEVAALDADGEYRSANGDVVVRVDPALAARVDLETGNGEVRVRGVDLDRSVDDRRRVRGRMGAGGYRIRARTANGDVTLRAR